MVESDSLGLQTVGPPAINQNIPQLYLDWKNGSHSDTVIILLYHWLSASTHLAQMVLRDPVTTIMMEMATAKARRLGSIVHDETEELF